MEGLSESRRGTTGIAGKTFFLLTVIAPFLLLMGAGQALAARINLAWDAVNSDVLTGYRVYYGEASGTYTSTVDTGLTTNATIKGLTENKRYYFAVTALGASDVESDYSKEMTCIIKDGITIGIIAPETRSAILGCDTKESGSADGRSLDGGDGTSLATIDEASCVIPSPRSVAEYENWLQISSTGDFDGDGTPDILWRQNGTGKVAIWYMAPDASKKRVLVAAVDEDWEIFGVENVNDDAVSDILWRKSREGRSVAWIMEAPGVNAREGESGLKPGWRVVAIDDSGLPVQSGQGWLAETRDDPPRHPSAVYAYPQGEALYVHWDPVMDADVVSYRVRIFDPLRNDGFEEPRPVDAADGSLLIENLEKGVTYGIAVSAVDLNGRASEPSPLVYGRTGGGISQAALPRIDASRATAVSNSGGLDGITTLTVPIGNPQAAPTSMTLVSCYYGRIDKEHLIDSAILLEHAEGQWTDLRFRVDSSLIQDKTDAGRFFVTMEEWPVAGANQPAAFAAFTAPLTYEFTVNLHAGWNFVSFPLMAGNVNPDDVFADIADNVEEVFAYDGAQWLRHDFTFPGDSTLPSVVPGSGYWVRARENASLTIRGAAPARERELEPGWNLVGYKSETARPVEEALASIDGRYDLIWGYGPNGWEYYAPGQPRSGTLEVLQPGRAYWILTSQKAIWTLP